MTEKLEWILGDVYEDQSGVSYKLILDLRNTNDVVYGIWPIVCQREDGKIFNFTEHGKSMSYSIDLIKISDLDQIDDAFNSIESMIDNIFNPNRLYNSACSVDSIKNSVDKIKNNLKESLKEQKKKELQPIVDELRWLNRGVFHPGLDVLIRRIEGLMNEQR